MAKAVDAVVVITGTAAGEVVGVAAVDATGDGGVAGVAEGVDPLRA